MTRHGWLSLFMAATTITDIRLLPVLVIAILPVWLLLTGRREMLIVPDHKADADGGRRPSGLPGE